MIRLIFYGTPEIAAVSLKSLLSEKDISIKAVITQPDRPVGRKQLLTPSPVKAIALEQGLPIIQPERIKRTEQEFISSLNALGEIDAAVVVAFGQILPQAVLDVPRKGSINLHASLLPRWRGAAPIQRAIMAGDEKTGVCLMQMDAGLDTGPVFAEKEIAIDPSDTAQSLHDKIAADGARLIVENIRAIVAGTLRAIPQPAEGVTYAEKISDADSLIDWNNSAHAISCQTRGLSPFPAAFSYLNDKRIKLFDCTPAAAAGLPPGTISGVATDSFTVSCGASSSLIVRGVQIEGKKRVSAEEFLRGNPLPIGARLGERS